MRESDRDKSVAYDVWLLQVTADNLITMAAKQDLEEAIEIIIREHGLFKGVRAAAE